MKTRSWFPPPNKLFNNEINTLNRIANNPTVKKYFPRLCYDADDFLSRNQSYIRRKKPKDFDFDFKSQIEAITISNQQYIVYLGALMKAKRDDYEILTYYFMLCNSVTVIRKFHFDYAPEYINRSTPHPNFHLQYPGELSGHLQSLNLAYDHLACCISEPRIPFIPMSLALTINLIFKEFKNEDTRKTVQDTTWRNLIKTNEDLCLKDYFIKCNTFFSGSGIELFTNDFCYGS